MTGFEKELLITVDDIRSFRDIGDNVNDDRRVNPFIFEAQINDLRGVIGESLYNALLNGYLVLKDLPGAKFNGVDSAITIPANSAYSLGNGVNDKAVGMAFTVQVTTPVSNDIVLLKKNDGLIIEWEVIYDQVANQIIWRIYDNVNNGSIQAILNLGALTIDQVAQVYCTYTGSGSETGLNLFAILEDDTIFTNIDLTSTGTYISTNTSLAGTLKFGSDGTLFQELFLSKITFSPGVFTVEEIDRIARGLDVENALSYWLLDDTESGEVIDERGLQDGTAFNTTNETIDVQTPDQRWIDLMEGTEYLDGQINRRFHGVRAMLSYFSYSRLVQANQRFVSRYDNVKKETDESSSLATGQVYQDERDSQSMAVTVQNELIRYLEVNRSTYNEFQDGTERQENKKAGLNIIAVAGAKRTAGYLYDYVDKYDRYGRRIFNDY